MAHNIRGLAALVSKPIEGEESILVFWNTPQGHLSAEVRSPKKDDVEFTFNAKGAVPRGVILPSSQLGAAVRFHGLNLVVGITRAESLGKPHQVSVISPVYQPLVPTSSEKTIAVCSSEDDAWIFYLSRKTDQISTIKGVTLAGDHPIVIHEKVAAINQSSLASYFEPEDKRAYIIFQSNERGDTLWECDHTGNKLEEIKNSSDALKGTPLAVTFTDDSKVYLYYVNDNYLIRRIVKDKGKWKSSEELPGVNPIAERSQLTVVTANKKNNIFFAPKNGKKFIEQAIDKL